MESLRCGHAEMTVADLLAGLSMEEDSRAARIAKLKDNAFYLRWLTGLPALPARETPDFPFEANSDSSYRAFQAASPIEPDYEARRALAYAVLEADRDRQYWIDSDHLLRGLLRFPNKADFALLKTEISLDSARAASHKDRETHLPEQNPNLKVMKYLVRKYIALLAPPVLSLACYLYILFEELGVAATPLAH